MKKLKNEKEHFFLVLLLISMNIYLASTAARFLFTMSPFIALLSGYGIVKIVKFLWANKNKEFKIISLFILLIVGYLILSMSYTSAQSVKYSGSGLAGQWEDAMNWIKYNTPKDAIITHWWDYGYWTQSVAERASTHDGGTHAEDSLQLLGRYAMTGINDTKIFTYLKTRNVSYLLYSEEEIGKYHAFSFIGSESDENLDRESTIGIFNLAQQREIRNGQKLIYQGTWVLDQDIVINRRVIPKEQAAIIGIQLIKEGNQLKDPKAILYYNGNQYMINITCMVFEGKRVKLNAESPLPSCISFIPFISNQNQLNKLGGIIFTSSKVKDGLFARLYLFNQSVVGFKEVYNDGVPLALYNGRLIGPIRIWKVEYPPNIKADINEYLTETERKLLMQRVY